MSSKLTTVPDVQIVKTGTYHLAGNPYQPDETTFTADDLRDAAAAIEDSGITAPRLKLGHFFEWGDAEPAFGKVANARFDEDTQTLLADLVDVPLWLAEIFPAAYPGRSIEATFNFESATGNKYRMVLTALALLGVSLPGVATLEDLSGLYTEEAPEGIEVEGEAVAVLAAVGEEAMKLPGRKRKAKAQISVDDIRRSFYENWAVGDNFSFWIREMFQDPNELIVDDDQGTLYSMTYEVNGEEVEFSEPEPRKIQYVAATVSSDSPDPLLAGASAAVYASRADSRPDDINDKEDPVKLSDEQRERLGLSPDSSDEEVQEAFDRFLASSETPPDDGSDDDGDDGDDEVGEDDKEGKVEKTETAAASDDGTVKVDRETLSELERGAKAGLAAEARQVEAEKKSTLDGAVAAGKIPPARREHWEKQYDADPEGTKETLASLDAVLPVTEVGKVPTAEGASETSYPTEWLSPAERRAAAEGRETGPGTITQEA